MDENKKCISKTHPDKNGRVADPGFLARDGLSNHPEELDHIWDLDIAVAFNQLLPKQQLFLIEYLRSWNGAEAYRKAYNPLARNEVASANASRLIASDSISVILNRFSSRRTEALLLVARTFFEMTQATKPCWIRDADGQVEHAGDVPDWRTRKEGAEGLSKLYGLFQAPKVTHEHEVRSVIVRYHKPERDPIPVFPATSASRGE